MTHTSSSAATSSIEDCCSQLVSDHRAFRGLSVASQAMNSFTMYTIQLDQLGSFVSDSRQEAFMMAFEALFPRSASGAAHTAGRRVTH